MAVLKRAVGLRTVVSTGAGMALATVTYISFIELASYLTGNSAWIAILTSGLMAVLAGSCFCELNSMYPTAAGLKLYVEKAFNERVAIIVAGVYVMGQIAIVGAEVYIFSQVLSVGITIVPPVIWAIAFMALLFFLNYRGIRIAGMTQDIIAYTMFAGLILISVYGFYRIDFNIANPITIGSLDGFIQAVAIGISSYIAFEWVVTISEEVTDVKLVPKGMMIGLGVLAIVYALFSTAMTSVLGNEGLAWALRPDFLPANVPVLLWVVSSDGLPIPHVLYGMKLLGRFGLYFMIGMSILASLTSLNAGLLTFSRFVYAMARDWSLPRLFAKLHPKHATPWVAMVVVIIYGALIITYTFATHFVLSMIFTIVAVECMMYVIMALSVIRLRFKDPDRERSFKIKGGIVFPIIVIIIYGIVGCFILFGPVNTAEDLLEQRIALYFIIGLIIFNTIYAFLVWPRLRAKYQKIADARVPRRRRRP